MIVELHGAHFKNKGAQLMLRTVVSELSERIDDIDFVVGTKCGNQVQRAALDLKQIIPVRPWMDSSYYRLLLIIQRWMSKDVWRNVVDHDKFFILQETDALIDLSGFAFTDQWGITPIKNFASLSEVYQSRNKPVVMLPQAVGPFRKPNSQHAFRRVIDNVDLLYLRDDRSVQFAKQVNDQSNHIRYAPDMTFFYPPRDDRSLAQLQYCCIIPSKRMFDQGKTDWGQKYHRMIMLSVEESLKKGFQVYFVVHDTSDQSVVESFVDKFKEQRGVKVYQEEDPVVLKKFIGKSAYIVGSRYHGILAAFSYGVPALCMGWAHKYIYLFKEFGLEEYMLTPQTSPAELVEKISQIAAPKKNREIKTAILQKVAKLKLINQQMWDEVVEVITQ